MPKYRQLHTKIIDSFDFNNMPDDFHRLSWILLTLVVDSEGRGIDAPAWIRAKMYPLREDVSNTMIIGVMDWFENRGMVVRYQSEGNPYFFIPTWKEYQRGTEKEARSNFPAPPEKQKETVIQDKKQLRSNSGVTPELVKSYSASDADADADSNADADAGGYDAFFGERIAPELTGDDLQHYLIAQWTKDKFGNLPDTKRDNEAVKVMVSKNVTCEDLDIAYSELTEKHFDVFSIAGLQKAAILVANRRTAKQSKTPTIDQYHPSRIIT